MSNFGAKLAELLERKNLRAADLGRLTKLSDALISKWINGQQTFVDVEDLGTICACLSSNPKEQAELVRAHLQDEVPVTTSELIDIRIRGTTALKEDATPYRITLPLKLQRAFDVLARESVNDADVRAVVLGMANLLEPAPSSGRQLAEDFSEQSLQEHEAIDERQRKRGETPSA